MDDTTRHKFLDELCPHLRTLIECLMDCDCGCEVVDFFRHRKLTLIEARDIAGHLQRPLNEVAPSLDRLVEMGILERQVILDWTLYGLARDAQIRNGLEQFWLLRDAWRQQWEQTQETLHLRVSTLFDLSKTRRMALLGNTHSF